jgi:peptidoglycan/xylan/chitin deacetylase (PgdA/CDA1 family)
MPLLAVNHHYFRSNITGQGIYPTTPDALVAGVNQLRSRWRIGGEEDILQYCESRNTTDAVCILTFDDGLKEQMRTLALLDQLNVTAMYFIPTAPLVLHEVLDVHKLHMIRSKLSDAELAADLHKRFNFQGYAFDDQLLAIQYRYDTPISRKVKYYLNFVLDPAARVDWTRQRFVDMFGSERAVSETLYMNVEDIRVLAGRHLLGTHAHAHVPLATLAAKDAEQEIEKSLDVLENLSGRRPAGISYPFGGQSAVSESVFATAQALGLQYGFTMERGVNTGNEKTTMALKRIDVNDIKAWVEPFTLMPTEYKT